MTNYITSVGVQQVSITIASGSTSNTATIAAVGAGAFIIFQGCNPSDTGAGAADNDTVCTVALTNSTTVTAKRGVSGSSQTVIVNAVVIDGDPTNLIKSIQSGTVSMSISQSSNTAAISAVTNANAAIFFLGSTTTSLGIDLARSDVVVSLSGTTVTATKGTVGEATTTGFIVVEFQGSALNSSVQNIAYDATLNAGSVNIGNTSVTAANAFLAYGGASGSSATTSNEQLGYAQLISGSHITVTWNTSGNLTRLFNYCVVEFVPGVLAQSVQRGTISLSSATSNTATITSSALSSSFANWLGNSTASASYSPETDRFNLTQTNATTLTMSAKGAATGTGSYEVVQFTPYSAPGGQSSNSIWFGAIA